VALTMEMEVASTMRAPPSVDYNAAARLVLIVEAEAGVAWANSKRRAREAEEAEGLLLARENNVLQKRISEVEEMIGVNEVSIITAIAPATSAFVVFPADLASTQMSFFPQHPVLTPPTAAAIAAIADTGQQG
jgi:hypothetical protein